MEIVKRYEYCFERDGHLHTHKKTYCGTPQEVKWFHEGHIRDWERDKWKLCWAKEVYDGTSNS